MYMSKTMKDKKRTVYRHLVTNKFISKAEWESLQEPKGADFDVEENYIKETKEFMKNIEEDFNKLRDKLVETSPPQEEEPSTWKLFFSKLKFWQ